MTDKQLIAEILLMDSWELLEYVLSNPTDLTDSYCTHFRAAIYKRAEELGVFPNE